MTDVEGVFNNDRAKSRAVIALLAIAAGAFVYCLARNSNLLALFQPPPPAVAPAVPPPPPPPVVAATLSAPETAPVEEKPAEQVVEAPDAAKAAEEAKPAAPTVFAPAPLAVPPPAP